MKLRLESATFNPVDFIEKGSPLAIDDCNAVAQALVVRSGEEKGDGIHFLDAAEMFIGGVTATVAQYGQKDKGTRSLQTVREMLTNPQKLDMAIKLMCESDAWGGMLARMGGQLMHFVDKEKSSALTTTGRFLRFLDTLAVAESTKISSFDPAKLRNGKMTIYLVLPPEHMRTQSPLLRLWIGSLLRAVVRGGLQEKKKVHFVLDEAASLGHLEELDDAVDKYRGYGVRLQFYYQSMGQLKKCWPRDEGQTLLSNTTQCFFGVNDQPTAEYVSKRLGPATIVVKSGGSSSGQSWQDSFTGGKGGTGYSRNSNTNWQQQARELLKPDEVLALDPRIAITFLAGGMRPVWTRLVRYYEEKKLFKRRGWLHGTRTACGMFVKSACVLLLAGVVAFAATTMMKGVTDARQPGGKTLRGPVGNDQGEPRERSGADWGGAGASGGRWRP